MYIQFKKRLLLEEKLLTIKIKLQNGTKELTIQKFKRSKGLFEPKRWIFFIGKQFINVK